MSKLLLKLDSISGNNKVMVFASRIHQVKIGKEEIENYCIWNKSGLTRNYLRKTEEYELLLLCWEPGQRSSIHDHNGQRGWCYVIEGTIREEQFEFPKIPGKMKLINNPFLKQGELAHIRDDIGLHRLSNVSDDERAITLHLYVKPLERVNVFNEFTGTMREITLEYDPIAPDSYRDGSISEQVR